MDEEPKFENPSPAPQTPPNQSPPQSSSGTGLEPNLAALLSYLFGWIGGVVFLVIEKDDKYVRFHAIQSIAFSVVIAGVWIVISIVSNVLFAMPGFFVAAAALIGLIISVLWLAIFVLWIVLMVKAYAGEKFKLPIIGDFAEKQVG